jgi:hypothetical protein
MIVAISMCLCWTLLEDTVVVVAALAVSDCAEIN